MTQEMDGYILLKVKGRVKMVLTYSLYIVQIYACSVFNNLVSFLCATIEICIFRHVASLLKVERGADSSKEILYNPKKRGNNSKSWKSVYLRERERKRIFFYPILRKKVGRFLLKDTTRINWIILFNQVKLCYHSIERRSR